MRLQRPDGGQAEQQQDASRSPRDEEDGSVAPSDRVSDDQQECHEPTGKQGPASYSPKGEVLILFT